jgi:hypothetical protein
VSVPVSRKNPLDTAPTHGDPFAAMSNDLEDGAWAILWQHIGAIDHLMVESTHEDGDVAVVYFARRSSAFPAFERGVADGSLRDGNGSQFSRCEHGVVFVLGLSAMRRLALQIDRDYPGSNLGAGIDTTPDSHVPVFAVYDDNATVVFYLPVTPRGVLDFDKLLAGGSMVGVLDGCMGEDARAFALANTHSIAGLVDAGVCDVEDLACVFVARDAARYESLHDRPSDAEKLFGVTTVVSCDHGDFFATTRDRLPGLCDAFDAPEHVRAWIRNELSADDVVPVVMLFKSGISMAMLEPTDPDDDVPEKPSGPTVH